MVTSDQVVRNSGDSLLGWEGNNVSPIHFSGVGNLALSLFSLPRNLHFSGKADLVRRLGYNC